MLKNYFITSLRNILRNRAISSIKIFGLSVSMTVCFLLIIIVSDQLSYDTFHKDRDRMFRIITDRVNLKSGDIWSTASTAYPLADLLKEHESIETLSAIKTGFSSVIKHNDIEMPFEGLYTDLNFFNVFNFPFKHGSPEKSLTQPKDIILSHELAEKLFKDIDPIGQVFEIEGYGDFTVKGVLEAPKGKTQLEFDVLVSTALISALEREGKTTVSTNSWDEIYTNYIYFKLKSNRDVEALNPLLLRAVENNYLVDDSYRYEFKVQKFSDIIMGPELSNSLGLTLPRIAIFLLSSLALIVLVLACLNYANLTTARVLNRAKEIGIRKSIGAQRKQVFYQFLIESVLFSIISFVFADLLAQYLHPKFNTFLASQGAPISFDVVPNIYIVFLVFSLLTGLIAGFFPALILSGTNPLTALKKSISISDLSSTFKLNGAAIKKGLLVIQFTLTIFFIITILIINQQFSFVINKDHGFKTQGIVNVKLNGVDYDLIKSEFEKLAEVDAVTATTHYPARGTNYSAVAQKDSQSEQMAIDYFGVDDGYVEAMEIELIAGKSFEEASNIANNTVIINQTAIKKMEFETAFDAVGQFIMIDSVESQIIGVVKDYHYQRLDEKIGVMVLRKMPQDVNNLVVSIASKDQQQALSTLTAAWNNVTNRPFESSYFEDDMKLSYGHYQAMLVILGFVTILLVSIACLGLLGMVMFQIQYKMKEIGIRKTLGANHKHIMTIVGKKFFIMLVISNILGGVMAYFANSAWLETQAYRINFSILTPLFGFSIIVLLVLLTVGFQLYRALKINPVDLLRSE